MTNRVFISLPSTAYVRLTDLCKERPNRPREVAAAMLLWAASGADDYPLAAEKALPYAETGSVGSPTFSLPALPEVFTAASKLREQRRTPARAVRAALDAVDTPYRLMVLINKYPIREVRRGPPRGTSPMIIRTGDGLGFTAKERERLKTLASAWGMEPEQALRMLVITHLSFVLPGAQAPSCQRVPHAEPSLTPEASS